MLSELFNVGTKKKDAVQDPLADFLSSVLSKNDAAITIRINAANSKNRRNQSGNFESVDAMSDYPKASTDVLQSLGITPTVEDGLNPMTERLAATSSPFGRGLMGTDILANMGNPDRPAGAAASADILPMMLLLMLAQGNGSQLPMLPGSQGPAALPPGLQGGVPTIPATPNLSGGALPPEAAALLGGGAPQGGGELPPELLALLAGGGNETGIPMEEAPLSPLPAPTPGPVTPDMLNASNPSAVAPQPAALKELLAQLGGGGRA